MGASECACCVLLLLFVSLCIAYIQARRQWVPLYAEVNGWYYFFSFISQPVANAPWAYFSDSIIRFHMVKISEWIEAFRIGIRPMRAPSINMRKWNTDYILSLSIYNRQRCRAIVSTTCHLPTVDKHKYNDWIENCTSGRGYTEIHG